MGLSRRQVARVLGEPRAACMARAITRCTIWDADVWYFPFDLDLALAAAIEFRDDRASHVLQITLPAQSHK